MALARLLVQCSRMLQHSSISLCWLAASAAQGHKQWQQFACMQQVAPAASPSPGQPPAQQCSRLREQAKAVPQHISPSATAAGHARTAGFQLPGLAPCVRSRHQQHKQTRGLSSTPLQDDSSQQQPQAVGDTSPALSGRHSWQHKRPADMDSFERLLVSVWPLSRWWLRHNKCLQQQCHLWCLSQPAWCIHKAPCRRVGAARAFHDEWAQLPAWRVC